MMRKKPGNSRGKKTWLLVAHSILHLSDINAGVKTWWCVDPRSADGDTAILYVPGKGAILHLRIHGDASEQLFCRGFKMKTAQVEVMRRFKVPITAKHFKKDGRLSKETWVRSNFQKKAFLLGPSIEGDIIDLADELEQELQDLKKASLQRKR